MTTGTRRWGRRSARAVAVRRRFGRISAMKVLMTALAAVLALSALQLPVLAASAVRHRSIAKGRRALKDDRNPPPPKKAKDLDGRGEVIYVNIDKGGHGGGEKGQDASQENYSEIDGAEEISEESRALKDDWRDYVEVSTSYSGDGSLTVSNPSVEKDGLLVLFLSRTDGYLPFEIGDGWDRVGECYKSENQQGRCFTVDDCSKIAYGDGADASSRYCTEFSDGTTGEDLATVVYARRQNGAQSYSFSMPGDTASWAVLANVETQLLDYPSSGAVRDLSGTSCDGRAASVFPSVNGKSGDLLLMFMANDESESASAFQPPDSDSVIVGYVAGYDETGILYGKVLKKSGGTGSMSTRGDGSYECRDETISLTLRGR